MSYFTQAIFAEKGLKMSFYITPAVVAEKGLKIGFYMTQETTGRGH